MLSANEMVRLNANMSHQMIATPMGEMLRKMVAERAEGDEGGDDEGRDDGEDES